MINRLVLHVAIFLVLAGLAALSVNAEPPVRNAVTELQIGPVVIRLSRYPDDGDLHSLIFTLTRGELDSVSSGDQAFVRYEPSNLHDVWTVGSVDPSTAEGCAIAYASAGRARLYSRAL